ncbi:MAG: hypothetical protein QOG15_3361 [Solirubrobacteraceae bacterium]|jgi:HD-GYP domain-containing protein (c-di-GMP phosphodiesterase class II)|nr:hypothetical protein [Solirubrobacteraceae bacterium]
MSLRSKSPRGLEAGPVDRARVTLSAGGAGLVRHLSNVAKLADEVSRRLGLPAHEIRFIRVAAALHDLGKVVISSSILDKPGPLSDAEWLVMRRHTVIGERILRAVPLMAPAAALVRSSHERYDGSGYPDGFRAGEIAIGASIIAICDAYDAIVNDRVYRKARSHDMALAELRRCAGSQFDPAIVELFCSTMETSHPGRSLRIRESGVG